jgi:hypothetical protein
MENNKPPYAELIQLKQSLRGKMDTLRRQYEEAKQNYESVVNTLSLLGYREAADLFQAPLDTDYSKFKGLTQAQALVRLAKENNGRFKMRDAKRILIAAGLIRTPKNANNILYNVIQREEGKFKRVAPGEYELVA